MRQAYGALEYGGVGVGLMLRQGVAAEPVTFRLLPPAAISGRVRLADGSPAENVRIQLLRATTVRGRRETVAIRTFFADDRGEFRFAHLGAGTYYLAADGRPWFESVRRDNSPSTVYARVYFPNASSPDGAAPIALREGDEFNADLTVTETTAFPASLRLTGTAPQRAAYVILGQSTGAVRVPIDNGTIYNGTLETPPVTPGTYEVLVNGAKDGRTYQGRATIELGRAGQSASIAMAAVAALTGEATCDGRPGAGEGQTIVVLSNARDATAAPVAGNGRIHFPGVAPGEYTATSFGGRSCYLGRVLAGGKPLPGGKLTVGTDDIANLTFEMRSDGARLRGRVARGERMVAGARVIVMPVDGPRDLYQFPRYVSDNDGSFSFENLPPGDYFLFSPPTWEIEFDNAKAMAPLLEKGVRVTLPAKGDVRVDLPLEPRP